MKRKEIDELTHADLFEIAKLIKNPFEHDRKATVIKYENQKWHFDCGVYEDDDDSLFIKQWEAGRLFFEFPIPSRAIVYTKDGKIKTWAPDEVSKKEIYEAFLSKKGFKYLESSGIKDITEQLKSEPENEANSKAPSSLPNQLV